MIAWLKHIFSANGHSHDDGTIEEAHAMLRVATHAHIEADRRAAEVSVQTEEHANRLTDIANRAVSAVKGNDP